LKSVYGCDSLVTTVNLSIKAARVVNTAAFICTGQTFRLPSGVMANASGIYSDTLRYQTNCDSLITNVTLKVQSATVQNKTVTICSGETYYLPSGVRLSTAGLFRDTARYASGCDSLISSVSVAVRTTVKESKTATMCEGQSYMLPWGSVVKTAGIYNDTSRYFSGCDSAITSVNLLVQAGPRLRVIKSNDINCIVGTATIAAWGGSGYTWQSSSGAISNPTAQKLVVSPTANTVYKVRAMSANGCMAEDSIEVKVNKGDPDGGYLMPSAFTPNNDGKNDCFGVSAWGQVTDLRFQIYNRWGELVFQTTDPSLCWDGTYKGVPQSAAAFVYQVTAKTICGGPVYRKGTVVLIR
jgi:gliding motility-associated-like protein